MSVRSAERSLPVRAVGIAAGAIVGGVLLFLSLRGVDWHQLGRTLAGAQPLLLVAVCGLNTVTLALRALRWRLLLTTETRLPYPTVFWATAAGYFGNNFLPARTGELVRTFLITTTSGLDTSYVLATALAERVVDAIVLVLIAASVLSRLHEQSAWLADAARVFAIAGAVGGALILFLPLTGTWPHRVVERTPLPRRIKTVLLPALDGAIAGLRAFHDVRRLSGFLILTCVIWTIDASATVTAGLALGFHVPFALSFLVLSAMGLASAVPSTPGYVGVYQFVAVIVLTPFGFSRSDAIAFVVVLQAASYAVNALWGSIGVARGKRVVGRRANV